MITWLHQNKRTSASKKRDRGAKLSPSPTYRRPANKYVLLSWVLRPTRVFLKKEQKRTLEKEKNLGVPQGCEDPPLCAPVTEHLEDLILGVPVQDLVGHHLQELLDGWGLIALSRNRPRLQNHPTSNGLTFEVPIKTAIFGSVTCLKSEGTGIHFHRLNHAKSCHKSMVLTAKSRVSMV